MPKAEVTDAHVEAAWAAWRSMHAKCGPGDLMSIGVGPVAQAIADAEQRGREARGSVISCEHCVEERPASCIGQYEGDTTRPRYACDTCCGHGNEDGWCSPVQSVRSDAERKVEALRDAITGYLPFLPSKDGGLKGPGRSAQIDAANAMRSALREGAPND